MEKSKVKGRQQAQKLQINILNPNNSLNSHQIPKMQHLHMSFLGQNYSQSSKSTRVGNTSYNQSRIKLRDYLFQAQTSANKTAYQKRKMLQNMGLKKSKENIKQPITQMTQSKAELRKNKYGIKNSEMFDILKKEVSNQLAESMYQIQKFTKDLQNQLKDRKIPTNSQMVMMYNLRALVKQKIKTSIKQMQQLLIIQPSKQNPIQIQILLDENQLTKDIAFTQHRFSKKYLEVQRNGNL